MKHIRTGVTFGVLSGLFTFLFGGWSVAVMGMFAGAGLGLALESKLEHDKPMNIARQAFPAALTASLILLALSLFQNFVMQPATGKFPTGGNVFIPANIIGVLLMIGLSMLTVSFRGLDAKNEQRAKMILLAALVIVFPFVDSFTGLRWSSNFIFALIFVILGLGLNIVVGYAGLLDLGYAAFFAIGAYTTGILSSPHHDITLNFWLVIWIAAAMAAIWGIMLGAPTLPLRGDYLAIVTLGFGEIVPVLFKNLIDITINEPLTCWIIPGIQKLFGATNTVACINLVSHFDLTAGEKGINPIGRPTLPIISHGESMGWVFMVKIAILLAVVVTLVYFFFRAYLRGNLQTGTILGYVATLLAIIVVFIPIPHPETGLLSIIFNVIQPGEFRSNNTTPWYFLIIGIIILSVFFIRRLRDSRLGRAWMAIREDELAAAQMGINPVRTKLMAFAMGATFSGFAGAFYAAYIAGIFPSVFDFSASIMILCVVILGGIGNINGVIVGGLVIMTADRLFLPALKDFLKGLMDFTVLPSLASNPTLQAAVAQNANPILYRFLLFGLTLVIMMAVRPEGLIPSAQMRAELHRDEEVPTDELQAQKG